MAKKLSLKLKDKEKMVNMQDIQILKPDSLKNYFSCLKIRVIKKNDNLTIEDSKDLNAQNFYSKLGVPTNAPKSIFSYMSQVVQFFNL